MSEWLLTWTTYGTWLPGDERGFVGFVREEEPADLRQRLEASRADDARADDASRRVIHNIPGTPYDRDMPGLQRYAREQMRGQPVWLTPPQANTFLGEAQRTAVFRAWRLLAAAVMANHVHLVVGVPDDLPGERLLQEFKSYGSRVLNQQYGRPESGTWWTKSGSTRFLPNERAVAAAVEYVRRQQRPLALWIAGDLENPATSVVDNPATSVADNPATGVVDNPATGVVDNPATSVAGSKLGEPTTPVVGSSPLTPGRQKKDGGE
jgi:REP element-mobilizing transposase RayT